MRVAASFHPWRSAGPTNSSEHRASTPPIRIPGTPNQEGATLVWATTDDPTGGTEGIGAMTDDKDFTIE